MTTTSYTREAIDLSGVTGDWISVTGLGGGVAWLRNRAENGSLVVAATGQGEPRPGEWGRTPADGVFTNAPDSPTAMAFLATFEGDGVTSTLESYQAVGVMTGHTFHRYTDGSGRRDYFTREFYVPAAGRRPEPAGEFPAVLLSGRNAPGRLLGTWTCLAAAGEQRIATLECDLVDGEFTVRADAAGADGPVDLGTTASVLYADAAFPHSPPAFLATFDSGGTRVHLQARINRGVLVVCEFVRFTDGSGRSDFFMRECFRQ
ncbi:MAG TPA: hypothetical protein VF069_22330 [Streptosporangiaceae bacterium]